MLRREKQSESFLYIATYWYTNDLALADDLNKNCFAQVEVCRSPTRAAGLFSLSALRLEVTGADKVSQALVTQKSTVQASKKSNPFEHL